MKVWIQMVPTLFSVVFMVFSLSNFNDCIVFSFLNYTLKFAKRLEIVLTFAKIYIYMNAVTEK
jgi:hypothetical protein